MIERLFVFNTSLSRIDRRAANLLNGLCVPVLLGLALPCRQKLCRALQSEVLPLFRLTGRAEDLLAVATSDDL